jgi:hypothetical protein
MKTKLTALSVLLTSILLVLPNPSRGQSTFYFSNLVPGVGLDAPVFDAEGTRLSSTSYVAMLYGGATPDSLQPAFDEVYFHNMEPVPFTYAPGGLAGYYRYFGYVQIGNVDAGTGASAWLQVRAWDVRLGETYEEVVALGIGGYGESTLFQKRGGDPSLGVPTPPEPLTGLESFSLRAIIPEPSASVLLLLGLPLVWLRNRCRG